MADIKKFSISEAKAAVSMLQKFYDNVKNYSSKITKLLTETVQNMQDDDEDVTTKSDTKEKLDRTITELIEAKKTVATTSKALQIKLRETDGKYFEKFTFTKDYVESNEDIEVEKIELKNNLEKR